MDTIIEFIKSKVKSNKSFLRIASRVHNLIKKNKKSIKGNNNNMYYEEAFLSNILFNINGDNNKVIIHPKSRISNLTIIMKGSGHQLIIGENCIIKSGVIWFEDTNCTISLGDNTTIEDAHIAVTEPNSTIDIGRNCMFSFGIDIRNGDSHSIIDLYNNKRINYAKDISIDDHVWLGAHVEILKGVNIGSNSVIGIRSVVSKNVPSNAVAAGTPAKVLRENITWDKSRVY